MGHHGRAALVSPHRRERSDSDVPEPDIELDTDGLGQDEVADTVWRKL